MTVKIVFAKLLVNWLQKIMEMPDITTIMVFQDGINFSKLNILTILKKT